MNKNKRRFYLILSYVSFAIAISVNLYTAIMYQNFFSILMLGICIGLGFVFFMTKWESKKTRKEIDDMFEQLDINTTFFKYIVEEAAKNNKAVPFNHQNIEWIKNNEREEMK